MRLKFSIFALAMVALTGCPGSKAPDSKTAPSAEAPKAATTPQPAAETKPAAKEDDEKGW